ncbi:MAG: DinB family protein [Planctomycetes bacterium]|nr:DinB family protein [Planctomycetota bacterium]
MNSTPRSAAARSAREWLGFRRVYSRARAALAWPDARLFGRVPEVSGWSPAEHLFHLCLASELVVRNLRMLAKGPGGMVQPDGEPILEARPIMASGILPRGERAPRMVTPPDDFDRAFLTELVESGEQGLERQAAAVQPLFDEAWTLPHQTLGPLTAEGWVRFARMHGTHHWRIVREIVAAQENR